MSRALAMRPTAACIASIAALALAGCGGSGEPLASTPVAGLVPPPAPANDSSVELLDQPATQELAVATRDDPMRVRYDASRDVYEVQTGTIEWSPIVDPPDVHDRQVNGPNRFFQIEGQPDSYFSIQAHHAAADTNRQYRYSNLAGWSVGGSGGDAWGNVIAFGTATPASGLPTTGTATYLGFATGEADVANDGWGAIATTPLTGSVKLAFDFATGSLAGSLSLASACDCLKTFAIESTFSDTIYARGSQTFSGAFASDVAGPNGFDGRFTGPAAEELIGSWTLPFMFEGTPHRSWGAWIAKRGD